MTDWQPYDPSWLVGLAEEQYPDQPWLTAALARCTRCHVESPAYTYFVDPECANKPGAAWQFAANIELSSPTAGPLLLDVLTEGRIGGVEFLKRIRRTGRR